MPGSWGRSSLLLFFVEGFCPGGQGIFLIPCFAHSGEALFFAPPKKSTQKKGDPGGLPATRVPCASRKARRSRNSLTLKQARASSGLYCDARLRQTGGGIQNQHLNICRPFPFALTEYRSQSGKKARTLSERIERSEIASCARLPDWRGTQGIGAADECTGVPFSLGTFSWALKRKYLARMGEIKR